MSRGASSSEAIDSDCRIAERRSAMTEVAISRKSYRWQRERTVTGIFCGSVVAKMNFTCGARLAHAAPPGEEKRMRHAPGDDRVLERSGDVLLADQILETLRAILAGEDDVPHGGRHPSTIGRAE